MNGGLVMDISSIATSALLSAQQVAQVRANNIVNAQTEPFNPLTPSFVSEAPTGGVAVFVQESDGPVNLVRETIGLISATSQYEAAAALIRTDEELNDTLLEAVG